MTESDLNEAWRQASERAVDQLTDLFRAAIQLAGTTDDQAATKDNDEARDL